MERQQINLIINVINNNNDRSPKTKWCICVLLSCCADDLPRSEDLCYFTYRPKPRVSEWPIIGAYLMAGRWFPCVDKVRAVRPYAQQPI